MARIVAMLLAGALSWALLSGCTALRQPGRSDAGAGATWQPGDGGGGGGGGGGGY